MGSVICDWLDVTQSPQDTTSHIVRPFLVGAGATMRADGTREHYKLGGGSCVIDVRSQWVRLSFSGQSLAALRLQSAYLDLLGLLGEVPHRVTRLDAAYDVAVDTPRVLKALKRQYKAGRVSLGRKTLPVCTYESVRDDGATTGTYYVGLRTKARATARVYDKQEEALKKRHEILPATTRYEITVRTGFGATLRDAAEPGRLFWHVASPALLAAPRNVEAWEPGWGGGWNHDVAPVDVAARLRYRVAESEDITAIIALADSLGDHGRGYLRELLDTRLGIGSALH
jgi:hypothetical protein